MGIKFRHATPEEREAQGRAKYAQLFAHPTWIAYEKLNNRCIPGVFAISIEGNRHFPEVCLYMNQETADFSKIPPYFVVRRKEEEGIHKYTVNVRIIAAKFKDTSTNKTLEQRLPEEEA